MAVCSPVQPNTTEILSKLKNYQLFQYTYLDWAETDATFRPVCIVQEGAVDLARPFALLAIPGVEVTWCRDQDDQLICLSNLACGIFNLVFRRRFGEERATA